MSSMSQLVKNNSSPPHTSSCIAKESSSTAANGSTNHKKKKKKKKVSSEKSISNCVDEESCNGSILGNTYIPDEVLLKILRNVNHKSLLLCQLVCKHWLHLVRSDVWHDKAEITSGRGIPVDEVTCWQEYFFICDKQPFSKNLIKNHSGEYSLDNWIVRCNRVKDWSVECPPVGAPELPDDPVFEGKNHCFVTSGEQVPKMQTIDLIKEGFSKYTLDVLQPTIKISEWFSCRWDCRAYFSHEIKLVGKNRKELLSEDWSRVIYEYDNQWHYITNEFKEYGPGLRKIVFMHQGEEIKKIQSDNQEENHHEASVYYGSKMAGACVKLSLPRMDKKKSMNDRSSKPFDRYKPSYYACTVS